MIKAIQNETKDAVTAMEQGVLQVQPGTEEAGESQQNCSVRLMEAGAYPSTGYR